MRILALFQTALIVGISFCAFRYLMKRKPAELPNSEPASLPFSPSDPGIGDPGPGR